VIDRVSAGDTYPIGDKRLDNASPARRFGDYRVTIDHENLPDGVTIRELFKSHEAGADDGQRRFRRSAYPLSALQHAVYCLRQAALIHVERLWEENRFTAEGRVLHARVDEQGQRFSRGVRRVSALPLSCRRYNSPVSPTSWSFTKRGATRRPIPSNISAARPSSTAPTRPSSARRRSALRR